MGNDDAVVSAFLFEGGRKLLLASSSGHGFIAMEDDCVSNTRKVKQVLNPAAAAEAVVCCAVGAAPGKRAQAGRIAPKGFPTPKKFGDD